METWFLPAPIDDSRAVRHGLRFVPIVWVRNLPGRDDIDGGCTVRPAVETGIEIANGRVIDRGAIRPRVGADEPGPDLAGRQSACQLPRRDIVPRADGAARGGPPRNTAVRLS